MEPESQDNADLYLAQAKAGRTDRIGPLLEQFRDQLAHAAKLRMDDQLHQRLSASDVVQETFLEAYRDFHQFRGRTRQELGGWLRAILQHTLLRQVERQLQAEKRSAKREVSLQQRIAALEPSAAACFEAALVSPDTSPSVGAQRRELAEVLAEKLAQLPEDYCEVLVLRHLEQLPFDEVARRMGRAPGAVRMLWLRALERLRRQMKPEELL